MESRTMEHRRASMLASNFFLDISYWRRVFDQTIRIKVVWSKTILGVAERSSRLRSEDRSARRISRKGVISSPQLQPTQMKKRRQAVGSLRCIRSHPLSWFYTECACSLRKKWLVACFLMILIASWMQLRSSGNCCQRRGTLQSRKSSSVALYPVSLNSFGLVLPCCRFVVPSLTIEPMLIGL